MERPTAIHLHGMRQMPEPKKNKSKEKSSEERSKEIRYRIAYRDFKDIPFTYLGKTRSVFRKGSGPAVVVIHEIPGLHPGVFELARKLVDEGFSVYLPSLVGTPGKKPSALYSIDSFRKVCISKEFTLFATKKTSPITNWLRALARTAHKECGGPGVGVIGMCLTGGFALAMAADKSVLAPVLSQPSLPAGLTRKFKSDLGISNPLLNKVKQRVEEEDFCVLGMRFSNDLAAPKERFSRLKQELGDGFIAINIDSSPSNPHGIPKMAHSVLTLHFVDEPQHPTRKAYNAMVDFFHDRLDQEINENGEALNSSKNKP